MLNKERPDIRRDQEEKQAEDRLKSLISPTESRQEPASEYWPDLISRTNRRVDAVSSGRSISISWAARVALPGAIAILFFFIGLHYYVPEKGPSEISVTEIVSGMPAASQDSLVLYFLERSEIKVVDETLLNPSEEDIENYLASGENPSSLLRTLPENEVNEILMILRQAKELSLPQVKP